MNAVGPMPAYAIVPNVAASPPSIIPTRVVFKVPEYTMTAYKPRLSVTMLRKNQGWNRISQLPTTRTNSRLSDARIVSRISAAVDNLFQKCMVTRRLRRPKGSITLELRHRGRPGLLQSAGRLVHQPIERGTDSPASR